MADLNSVLADLQGHRDQLARDLARVDAAIAALSGEAEVDASTNSPITDRIVELFESRPGHHFTAETALETLRAEGWRSPATDPVNAMRTALSRLARKGVITRAGRGEYVLPEPEEARKTVSDPWALPTDARSPQPWAATHKEAPF